MLKCSIRVDYCGLRKTSNQARPGDSSVPGGLSISSLGILEHIHRGVITSDGFRVGGGLDAVGGGGGGGLTLSGEVIIEAVKALGLSAVKVEQPVADKVVLVEHGAVGAEEAVLCEAASTDMTIPSFFSDHSIKKKEFIIFSRQFKLKTEN